MEDNQNLSANESTSGDASRDLYDKGREEMAKGDLSIAISYFEQSAKLLPHFKTLELLGECYLKQKHYQDALVPLAASVGLGSRPFRSLLLLARALEAVGNRDEAIEKLIDALAMQPTYRSARKLLDEMYTRRDRDRGKQPLSQNEEETAIEQSIAEVQALYLRAFQMQTEIDNAYEAARLKTEKFTTKYGRAPQNQRKTRKAIRLPACAIRRLARNPTDFQI